MQLPYGTLITSQRGPASLKGLSEAVAKETVTGYLRVSVFEGAAARECVVVFRAGAPAMSFVTDGTADRKDPDCRQLEADVRKEGAIIEVCRLTDGQARLLQELYQEFAITPPPVAKPVPPPEPAPAAVPRPSLKPVARAAMPEVRGSFVRAEDIDSLSGYLERHPGETGHLLFMAPRGGQIEEEHVLLIKGSVEAAYDGHAMDTQLPARIVDVPGRVEFYAVDEALLTSIINRYVKHGGPPTPTRTASAIGIPAKQLLEDAPPPAPPTRSDIYQMVGGAVADGSDEDAIAMVHKVEHDFAGHVDALLDSLELSHLRAKKKG